MQGESFFLSFFLLQFELVKKVIDFFSEVKLELAKVTWPTKDEVIRLTLVVIAISTIVGIYVGGVDYLFTKILELVIVR